MIDILTPSNIYRDHVRTISERFSAAMKTSGRQIVESGQEARLCATRQAEANGKRLMSTVEALSGAPDASHASQVMASYLSETSRTYVEHMSEWTEIFLGACKTIAPVLATLSTPPAAEPNPA